MSLTLRFAIFCGLGTVLLSKAVFGEKHSVKNEEVFPGGPAYGNALEEICKQYVFPKRLEFQGADTSRDNVIAENVDRDGNIWWFKLRARYSGEFFTVPFAETVRIQYNNGTICFNTGALKGEVNTYFLHDTGKDLEGFVRRNTPERLPGDKIKSEDSVYLHTRTFDSDKSFHHYLNTENGKGSVTTPCG